MSFSTPLRVAIAGGGPVGLTLAAILKKLSVSYTVFELDKSRSARSQGGILDIHKGAGQLALAKAGLIDVFKKHILVGASEFRLRDHKGTVHIQHADEAEEDPERPEIDRSTLRNILLDALDPQAIHWGKKITKAEAQDGGRFKLNFADGSTEEGFDILVGADGAWSKVRAQLCGNVPPSYSGLLAVATNISSVDERFPHLAEYVGQGTCFALGDSKAVMSQRSGDGSIKSYATFRAPEDWENTCGIDWKGPQKEALEKFVDEYLAGWSKEAKELITSCDEGELALRPLYQYAPGHIWKRQVPGVTLIGDAAHVITPFAGVGVNLGMNDAYDLALAIEKVAKGESSIDDALDEYEKALVVRTKFHAEMTLQNQDIFFGGYTTEEVVQKLMAVFGGPPPA